MVISIPNKSLSWSLAKSVQLQVIAQQKELILDFFKVFRSCGYTITGALKSSLRLRTQAGWASETIFRSHRTGLSQLSRLVDTSKNLQNAIPSRSHVLK